MQRGFLRWGASLSVLARRVVRHESRRICSFYMFFFWLCLPAAETDTDVSE